MTEKELNQFSAKINEAVRESAQKVTPPSFYNVLQKIAQDNSKEKYDEFLPDNEPLILPDSPRAKKKHFAAKFIGAAAAIILCVGLGAFAGVMLAENYSSERKYDSAADSVYFDEQYEKGNSSSSVFPEREDVISYSDVSSNTNDVSSRYSK